MRQQLIQSNDSSPTNQFSDESGAINLQQYFFLFLRNWYWLVLGLSIGLLVAWLKLRYATNIYQVEGTVLINEEQKHSISEEMIVADLGFQQKSNVEDELQILKSSSLMEKVVDSLDLNIAYFVEGRIKASEVYHDQSIRLFRYEPVQEAYGKRLRLMVKSSQTFALIQEEQDTLEMRFEQPFQLGEATYTLVNKGAETGFIYEVGIEYPQAVARRYAGALQLQNIGRSNVISMSMKDPVPEKAQEILTTLIAVYNQTIIDQKNSSGKKTLAFIDERLRFITDELYSVEKEVEGFRENNQLSVDITQRASEYLSQISDADKTLMELQLQQDIIGNINTYLQIDSNKYKALPLGSEILGGSLSSLVEEYNQLIFQREQRLEAATLFNPIVATFDEKLLYLRSLIRQSITTVKNELQERATQIKERIRPLEQRISAIPSNERQLLQIMRQQQIKESLFLFLLQKREETALSIAAQTANSRVLDAPVIKGKVSPDTSRYYLLAILLGLGIPGGFIFLRNYFDNKIYSKNDIERLTKAPFLGMIGTSKEEDVFVVKRRSRSAIAEMFRLLRTNLSYLSGDNEKQSEITLITSSFSGEGKTFISINLGLSMAQAGKKTLLLGFDLRKPKLTTYLTGEKSVQGISTYLVGKAPLSDLIYPVEGYEGVDFIGSGPIPPNPAELIMSKRTIVMLNELRQEYDCIIIDTAPLALVTDALLLAKHVDQTIIVTRFAKTKKAMVQMLDETYRQQKLPNLGIVLNGVESGQGYGYGYGYGSGYGYGYYDDDAKQKKWWMVW